MFADETPFVLHDDKAETTFDFRLADSLAKAKQQPIFQVSKSRCPTKIHVYKTVF